MSPALHSHAQEAHACRHIAMPNSAYLALNSATDEECPHQPRAAMPLRMASIMRASSAMSSRGSSQGSSTSSLKASLRAAMSVGISLLCPGEQFGSVG